MYSKQIPFFVKKENNGIALHFTSLVYLPNQILKLEWHYWRLNADFIKTLSDFGKLPETKTRKVMKMVKHNDHLKRHVEKLVR